MSEAISFSLHFLILLLFHFLSFSLFPFSLFSFFLPFFLPFFSFFLFLSLFFSSFNILKFLIAAKPQSFLIPHSTFHIYNILRAVA